VKVPLENIYYLLCYVHERFQARDFVSSAAQLADRTENLFAHILVRETSRLLRRGLSRRYLERSETLRGVRGKIELTPTLTRALQRRGELACSFEELSVDIAENQLLRAAMLSVSQLPRTSPVHRGRVAGAIRSLGAVSEIQLSPRAFEELRRHPPRRDYALALAVCKFIAQRAAPHLSQGEDAFSGFQASEQEMGGVFEDFVRQFIRIEIPGAKHHKRSADWSVRADPASLALLPGLQRDIPLELAGRRAIIECKFSRPLQSNQFGQMGLKSAHLYQIYAYLMNAGPEWEGLLLYGTVGPGTSASFELSGRRVRVESVDLAQPWSSIHEQMARAVVAGDAAQGRRVG